jgi:hypothetical protein
MKIILSLVNYILGTWRIIPEDLLSLSWVLCARVPCNQPDACNPLDLAYNVLRFALQPDFIDIVQL